MLDLRRLRLLHELHARGTIAAVAEALRFTPSAVSQQLTVLEREAGLHAAEPAGRGVRLTDAALVLVGHAGALLERAELAEADLAAATGRVAGRGRIACFQSAAISLACRRSTRSRERHPTSAASCSRPNPRPHCPRWCSGTWTSSSQTSGSTSPALAFPAWTVRTCSTIRCTWCCPRTTPRPAGRRRAVPLAELADGAGHGASGCRLGRNHEPHLP